MDETDTISRQAAIDALDKRFDDVPMELTTEILQLRRDLRERIPSAQPATSCSEIPNSSTDCISRQAAIDVVSKYNFDYPQYMERFVTELRDAMKADLKHDIEELPSAQPDRKLIDDYMWKIKQNISPHTAAEGVIAIKYYLEQIYEQIYGEGEKPKWKI